MMPGNTSSGSLISEAGDSSSLARGAVDWKDKNMLDLEIICHITLRQNDWSGY